MKNHHPFSPDILPEDPAEDTYGKIEPPVEPQFHRCPICKKSFFGSSMICEKCKGKKNGPIILH